MDVFPNFDGLSGIGDLKTVIGAALTIVLVIAVLMIIVSASIWAIASSTGNTNVATKARAGVLVALGAAVLLAVARRAVDPAGRVTGCTPKSPRATTSPSTSTRNWGTGWGSPVREIITRLTDSATDSERPSAKAIT